jgi:hypothetical protein
MVIHFSRGYITNGMQCTESTSRRFHSCLFLAFLSNSSLLAWSPLPTHSATITWHDLFVFLLFQYRIFPFIFIAVGLSDASKHLNLQWTSTPSDKCTGQCYNLALSLTLKEIDEKNLVIFHSVILLPLNRIPVCSLSPITQHLLLWYGLPLYWIISWGRFLLFYSRRFKPASAEPFKIPIRILFRAAIPALFAWFVYIFK